MVDLCHQSSCCSHCPCSLGARNPLLSSRSGEVVQFRAFIACIPFRQFYSGTICRDVVSQNTRGHTSFDWSSMGSHHLLAHRQCVGHTHCRVVPAYEMYLRGTSTATSYDTMKNYVVQRGSLIACREALPTPVDVEHNPEEACPDLPDKRGPPHGSVTASTSFDTKIMFTNRQIYQEASDIATLKGSYSSRTKAFPAIDSIRNCGEFGCSGLFYADLQQLLVDKGLVEECGRPELPGKQQNPTFKQVYSLFSLK